MATLEDIRTAIRQVLRDDVYNVDPYLDGLINKAVKRIAMGVRMPDGSVSPPLPELYTSSAVATTTNAYAALPATYQRGVHRVVDKTGYKVAPPSGGDYYAFALFMNRSLQDLSLAGSITICAVKGRNIYYQGIPAATENLTVHFYRKPVDMATGTDEPDGIPEEFQIDLIKHWVCKEEFGEGLEDGEDNQGVGVKYHTAKFYEVMTDLVDHIGIDGEPEYIHVTNEIDEWI